MDISDYTIDAKKQHTLRNVNTKSNKTIWL